MRGNDEVITLAPAELDAATARGVCALWQRVWPREEFDLDAAATGLLASGRQGDLRDVEGATTDAAARRLHLVRDEGRVVAVARSVARTVMIEGGPLRLLGLAGVCSDPAGRGRGWGRAVVSAALGRVEAGEFPFCLFQCTPKVQPFYEKLGAVVAENRFVNSTAPDPEARPFWDPVAMRYPAGEGWPAGPIDLHGPAW